MKRAPASSAVAIGALAIAIGAAAWGTRLPAAHAAQPEQPAVPSAERIELEVVVTEADRGSGTAAGASEGLRTWRVRAMTVAGNRVRINGEAVNVRATPTLRGDGRVAVNLEVLALRRNWADGPAAAAAIDATLDVVLDDGVPAIVAEASNPANDGVVAVEVTATVLDRPAAPPPPPAPGRPVATGPGGDAPAPAGRPVEPPRSPGC